MRIRAFNKHDDMLPTPCRRIRPGPGTQTPHQTRRRQYGNEYRKSLGIEGYVPGRLELQVPKASPANWPRRTLLMHWSAVRTRPGHHRDPGECSSTSADRRDGTRKPLRQEIQTHCQIVPEREVERAGA